jgi:hypothetical protein
MSACVKCGKPGADRAHIDVAAPGLLCAECCETMPLCCDFCAGSPIAWEFPVKEFSLDEYQYTSLENWLACEACAAFVMNEDFEALVGYSVLRRRDLGLEELTQEEREFVRKLHLGFAINRTGPPFQVDSQGRRIE